MTVNLRATMPGSRGAAAAAPDVRALVDQLGARVHIDVTIPRTDVKAKMRLCSRSEEFEAKAEARTFLAENGFPIDHHAHSALGAGEEWVLELATRMLARAVRDPASPQLALAALEDWRACDDQQILALWVKYQDLASRLDPVGAETITVEQLRELDAAAKKKDLDLLMQFGSRLLALYATTLASPPTASETPTSTSG